MKSIFVLQHTDREDLGAMEPYFRQLDVAVQYQRPLVTGKVAKSGVNSDGLVLLGGGAWGTTGSENNERTILPTLDQELRFTYDHMKRNRPIIAIGLGAQIACIAAGGGSEKAAPAFEVGVGRWLDGRRLDGDVADRSLPQTFPYASIMRDRPVPPPDAVVLAVDEQDRPLVFQIGRDVLCFTFHPGYSARMLNSIVEEIRADGQKITASLHEAGGHDQAFAVNLGPIMAGISAFTGWRPEEAVTPAPKPVV